MCTQISKLVRRVVLLLIGGMMIFFAAFAFRCVRVRKMHADHGNRPQISRPKPSTEFSELPKSMWPAPNRDGDGSALPCDLFTPPTVELHNGSFRVKDPATASLHLIDLEEIPYRLRMEGFAVSMDGSVSAFIRDGETGRLHALRSGQRSKDGLFSLENCNFLCGEIFSRCATVRDWSDGKIYRLPFDGAAAATEFRAKLVSISAGGPLHCEANGIGDSVSHGGRDYEFISADGDSILIRERLADGPCVRLYLTALESHDSDLDGA